MPILGSITQVQFGNKLANKDWNKDLNGLGNHSETGSSFLDSL